MKLKTLACVGLISLLAPAAALADPLSLATEARRKAYERLLACEAKNPNDTAPCTDLNAAFRDARRVERALSRAARR